MTRLGVVGAGGRTRRVDASATHQFGHEIDRVVGFGRIPVQCIDCRSIVFVVVVERARNGGRGGQVDVVVDERGEGVSVCGEAFDLLHLWFGEDIPPVDSKVLYYRSEDDHCPGEEEGEEGEKDAESLAYSRRFAVGHSRSEERKRGEEEEGEGVDRWGGVVNGCSSVLLLFGCQ